MSSVTEELVLERLRRIMDPDLHRDIVSLGFIKNLKIDGGRVAFDIELTTPACPVRDVMLAAAKEHVGSLPGVQKVDVTMTSNVRARAAPNMTENLRGVRQVVAVASGKGGVGKSTATINLALALARKGSRVGVLDADVYGPSIPAMVGLAGADAPGTRLQPDNKIIPLEKFGIKVMSMGFLANKETPVIWRGPMASKLVQQFLGNVAWGELDYLLIDLPPGTGDIQLTLCQSAPLTGAVIVTTPQDMALTIAEKGLKMFLQVNVPILGILENMSHYQCPECGHEAHIFRKGGGQRAATSFGVPFLGAIPLEEAVAESSDSGTPIVVGMPDSPSAQAYVKAAEHLAQEISIVTYAQKEAEKAHPTEYEVREDGRLHIVWSDGHHGVSPLRTLRANCPCAVCIDEWTGKVKVQLRDVPSDIQMTGADPVGRYATRFQWSDGHATGIYTFARLRSLCECESCIADRARSGLAVPAVT